MTPEERSELAKECLIYDDLRCCCKKNQNCDECKYQISK
jgi:hypothetical protein